MFTLSKVSKQLYDNKIILNKKFGDKKVDNYVKNKIQKIKYF